REPTAQERRPAESCPPAITGGVSRRSGRRAGAGDARRRRSPGGAYRAVRRARRATARGAGDDRRPARHAMSVGELAAELVSLYQRLLSPWLPLACRFAPTCSEYARLALANHGLVRGGGLALKRLASCHPLHAGGYDPPPARKQAQR